MKYRKLDALYPGDKEEILAIWNREYPVGLSYHSVTEFEHYLSQFTHQKHWLALDDKETIKGWCFLFNRDGKRWFAILIDSNCQRKGLGTKLLTLARKSESELNGWVVDHNNDIKSNGDIYPSPLRFYLKHGFNLLDDNRLEMEYFSAVQVQWKKKGRKPEGAKTLAEQY